MSDRKTYNKLVRDRIPEIIAADGRQCDTEIMSDDEYRRMHCWRSWSKKHRRSRRRIVMKLVKEIADLYEVIDALLVAFDLDREAVLAMQQKRRDERGGFEKRVKLLWTE
jgi:predicted house-cleaning noncanonical NTP pyrophosphatase (MazG superfamily)